MSTSAVLGSPDEKMVDGCFLSVQRSQDGQLVAGRINIEETAVIAANKKVADVALQRALIFAVVVVIVLTVHCGRVLVHCFEERAALCPGRPVLGHVDVQFPDGETWGMVVDVDHPYQEVQVAL